MHYKIFQRVAKRDESLSLVLSRQLISVSLSQSAYFCQLILCQLNFFSLNF